MGLVVKSFGIAVGVEDLQGTLLVAIQDGIDGELAGDVLHLAAAEVVGRCKGGAFVKGEGGEHGVPDRLYYSIEYAEIQNYLQKSLPPHLRGQKKITAWSHLSGNCHRTD